MIEHINLVNIHVYMGDQMAVPLAFALRFPQHVVGMPNEFSIISPASGWSILTSTHERLGCDAQNSRIRSA